VPGRYRTLIGLGIAIGVIAIGVLLLVGEPPIGQEGYRPPFSADPSCEPDVLILDADPPPGSCPQTVIPDEAPDSAVVTVQVEPDLPPCIEGCSTWLQAVDDGGSLMLQLPVPESPIEVKLPASAYEVWVYVYPPCQGTCEEGVSAMYACGVETSIDAGEAVTLEYRWEADTCGIGSTY
jgi:hypothetical protein